MRHHDNHRDDHGDNHHAAGVDDTAALREARERRGRSMLRIYEAARDGYDVALETSLVGLLTDLLSVTAASVQCDCGDPDCEGGQLFFVQCVAHAVGHWAADEECEWW